MYISKIIIRGFRNFKENEILFNDGINVIIGHNNAGKSNLLKAISLVLDSQSSKRLGVYDFNQNTSLEKIKFEAPKVSISLYISQSEKEDLNSDDLVTVGNYLTKLESPYEAMLTYEFFLPEKEATKYGSTLSDINDVKKAWKVIEREFLRLYTYRIFGGDPTLRVPADSENLQKFDFQFLDAIRDVERDMFSGRNTLLREVLNFFMDYDIKKGSETDAEKRVSIKCKSEEFSSAADDLLAKLQERMKSGKNHILAYANETGASFNNANPNFDGSISDVELFSALKLIVEYKKTGISLPATHNGLGYNNLIFMSLLLAKMQVNSDGNYLGSNAKVFPILAIEEPEAHLHPAMQYKFLKFLKDNIEIDRKVRQVFITTHSTHITSAVSLDHLICLYVKEDKLTVGYPGKVFSGTTEDLKSKAYVQRFLDATKSDILFAQKVILVEGIAEELLIPTMAKYLGISLEDKHIVIINVGGRYFDHFIKLFAPERKYSIQKQIVCITDRDPCRKKKVGKNEYFTKCYPYEYNNEPESYYYKEYSGELIEKYKNNENIRFFSQEMNSKTLEYDIALLNPTSKLLITDSISNKDELEELMTTDCFKSMLDKLSKSAENNRIRDSLLNSKLDDNDRFNALIASRYLNSVGKGENALSLSYILEENNSKDFPERAFFKVPLYIKHAIEWLSK